MKFFAHIGLLTTSNAITSTDEAFPEVGVMFASYMFYGVGMGMKAGSALTLATPR